MLYITNDSIKRKVFPKEIIYMLRIMICNYFFGEENVIVDETSNNVNVLEQPNAIEAFGKVAGKEANVENDGAINNLLGYLKYKKGHILHCVFSFSHILKPLHFDTQNNLLSCTTEFF